MTVTTKKYALPKNQYIKMALLNHMKTDWKWLLIPAAVLLIGLVLNFTGIYKNWWVSITALVGAILYVGFWAIQFMGVTQMDQNSTFFNKYTYEIDSRHILLKINAKEGSVLKWDMFQRAEKTKEGYILHIAKGQFFYFPFTIFNSENDLKLTEAILKRKELL